MKQPNWDLIKTEIREVQGELISLMRLIDDTQHPSEEGLEASFRHAYHHLNFAWHVRHVKTEKYAALTDSDYRRWGKFPKGFDRL